MTETTKILDISTSMVRKYVDKGKIRYLRPEGREQGFYNKHDVDKLATELNVFFAMESEVSDFETATIAEIPACIELSRELFTNTLNSTDDETLVKKWTSWMKKNPDKIARL